MNGFVCKRNAPMRVFTNQWVHEARCTRPAGGGEGGGEGGREGGVIEQEKKTKDAAAAAAAAAAADGCHCTMTEADPT